MFHSAASTALYCVPAWSEDDEVPLLQGLQRAAVEAPDPVHADADRLPLADQDGTIADYRPRSHLVVQVVLA